MEKDEEDPSHRQKGQLECDRQRWRDAWALTLSLNLSVKLTVNLIVLS